MAFIPYSTQSIDEDDIAAVTAVLRADYLTQGPAIPSFEEAFARYHGAPHGIAVNNATSALHLACVAMDVGPQSMVWTSPNSFVASANCARYCGAGIDFVDIDPMTRNMSVSALRTKLESAKASGKLPDVLVPVDFAGLPCDLREMRALADEYGFRILEDASHATGSSYLGAPTGSAWADATVFSFHAVKVVTTAEGGMITTHDAALADKLRHLRSHGITRETARMHSESHGPWYYEQTELGFNYRLTDLQAALGSSQLVRLPSMHDRRCALADRYDVILADLPLTLPARCDDRVSAWHLYAVEVDATGPSRRSVFEKMRAAGIGVNVHYIPIHTQPYYRKLGFERGNFPASEHYYDHAISLPLFPAMTEQQQDLVVSTLRAALSA
jgi:UDP-4-amino-4,6-dideoxy-N-acetyl-beta-L-altrosamine transaminase